MFILVVLVSELVLVCGSSSGRNNPMVDPCPVKDGCVKLPTSSQLLDLSIFETQMLGRLYSVPYYMEGPRLQNDYYRQELKYVREDDGNVYEHYKFRFKGNDTKCTSSKDNLKQPLNFDLDAYIGLEFGWQHSRWYYVSDDPTKFALIMICIDRKTLTDTACNGQFTIAVMVTQDPPDNVSWYTIEKKLREVFGLQMDDHRNHFKYIGDRCPEEI